MSNQLPLWIYQVYYSIYFISDLNQLSALTQTCTGIKKWSLRNGHANCMKLLSAIRESKALLVDFDAYIHTLLWRGCSQEALCHSVCWPPPPGHCYYRDTECVQLHSNPGQSRALLTHRF